MTLRTVFTAATIAWAGACSAQVATSSNRVVLEGDQANVMLQQCSRGAPKLGEGVWQPTGEEIDALEAHLPRALSARPEAAEVDFTRLLDRWRRQYVGVIRDGRRFIYGNFFPIEEGIGQFDWRTKPTRICDGGPVFFGVEFDVAAQRFTRIDFNGSI